MRPTSYQWARGFVDWMCPPYINVECTTDRPFCFVFLVLRVVFFDAVFVLDSIESSILEQLRPRIIKRADELSSESESKMVDEGESVSTLGRDDAMLVAEALVVIQRFRVGSEELDLSGACCSRSHPVFIGAEISQNQKLTSSCLSVAHMRFKNSYHDVTVFVFAVWETPPAAPFTYFKTPRSLLVQ